MLRYNIRPRYYVFNKNSAYARTFLYPAEGIHEPIIEMKLQKAANTLTRKLDTAERVKVEAMIANPSARLELKANKKGELSVHLTEVE